ncbi:radical SAM/SPASM domain-containing protein [Clostridium hydrogenum]|uniref:radical SAM/SPASM domain-containing protein n=1 Tax=Clostridium hydrogenum TaxID=2855764 RepID=UPI001F3F960A|nr:radical SAM protein [Clostridium hydrogenum]
MKNMLKKFIKNSINSYYSYFYVQWHLTSLCTENCNHCYLDKNKAINNVFDLKKSIDIIDQIYEISSRLKLQPYIAFTGGDPLLYTDLFKLINYAHDKNIIITIKGNPRLLNNDIIVKLKNLGVHQYNLSIDGLKQTHDYIRSKGSFDITIQKLKDLKRSGIITLVKYTVSKINSSEMNSVMNYLAECGVDYFDFARFCPNSSSDYKYMFTPEEYHKFLLSTLKNYQNLKVKGYKMTLLFRDHLWIPLLDELGILNGYEINNSRINYGCSIGNNNCFVINYNGDILPCAKLDDYFIGNILKDNIFNILQSENYKKLSELSSYKGCYGCHLVSLCRGCPAISKAISNDLFSKDAQCWIKKVQA